MFFSQFGAVKDCKIIVDRAGVSKGSVVRSQKLFTVQMYMYFGSELILDNLITGVTGS